MATEKQTSYICWRVFHKKLGLGIPEIKNIIQENTIIKDGQEVNLKEHQFGLFLRTLSVDTVDYLIKSILDERYNDFMDKMKEKGYKFNN